MKKNAIGAMMSPATWPAVPPLLPEEGAPPVATRPPELLPSRDSPMNMISTAICSQVRKVRSLAKNVLGSTRADPMAAAFLRLAATLDPVSEVPPRLLPLTSQRKRLSWRQLNFLLSPSPPWPAVPASMASRAASVGGFPRPTVRRLILSLPSLPSLLVWLSRRGAPFSPALSSRPLMVSRVGLWAPWFAARGRCTADPRMKLSRRSVLVMRLSDGARIVAPLPHGVLPSSAVDSSSSS
mmetsp:Transcript_1402/g.4176  ORF Transcript_1402/g.4176 Transcript_1402/m.4176 type:complete len:239 (-) Transcript_1402:663-1379(-)